MRRKKKTKREKHEDEMIREMKSTCGNGGMKSEGLNPPTGKKFTSRAVRPKNY